MSPLPSSPPKAAAAAAAVTVAGAGAVPPHFKLVFFVPSPHRQAVQTAIFDAGAGRYSGPPPAEYTECAWFTLGTGQFRPGEAANPHIGKRNQLEEVEEYRVEVLCCGEEIVRGAVEALKKTHPYEVPAYEVYKLEEF